MKRIRTLIVTILLIVLLINFIKVNDVQALTQTLSSDINSIDDNAYPGVKQLIKNLQTKYPKWNFKILYTDLDWNEVIANEYTGHSSSPRNLVQGANSKYNGEWICSVCGASKTYDNGSWNCASEKAIKYMMDPRNSLNESDIFQFMELSYVDTTFDQLKSMVTNTFLNNDLYMNTILEAGKTNNVNPYYLVARILQEQGNSGSTSISGTYSGYEGYYNIFNFNANGNTSAEIIANEMAYAKSHGWTSIELSIKGGTALIASGYIAKGQNTLYFQKFDVENSDGNLYWHQYMQNILAAQLEGEELKSQFSSIGALNASYTFIIPVYKNMPSIACARPTTTSGSSTSNANSSNSSSSIITTDLVKVNVNKDIALRNSPNGTKTGIKLYAEEVVTRLEKATSKVGGTYWDKVMKADGTTGYVARETYDYESSYKLYLVPVTTNSEDNGDDTGKNVIDDSSSNTGNVTVEPSGGDSSNSSSTTENVISDITTTNIKIENASTKATIIPGTTISKLKQELNNTNLVVKDANGNIKSDGDLLATGCKINDKYAVSVTGDVSGDGIVDARDATRILKYSIGTYSLSGEFLSAADVSKDGTIDARDAARILKYSVNQYQISL